MPQALKFAFAVLAIAALVSHFSYQPDAVIASDAENTPRIAQTRPAPATPRPVPARSSKRLDIRAGQNGHFSETFRLNGKPIESMIDTGASTIAINASQARSMGINLKPSDFSIQVDTANGITKAASTMLNSVQVGKITVQNVQALVLEDKALRSPLIGMSFLSKLRSYQVQNGVMTLQQ